MKRTQTITIKPHWLILWNYSATSSEKWRHVKLSGVSLFDFCWTVTSGKEKRISPISLFNGSSWARRQLVAERRIWRWWLSQMLLHMIITSTRIRKQHKRLIVKVLWPCLGRQWPELIFHHKWIFNGVVRVARPLALLPHRDNYVAPRMQAKSLKSMTTLWGGAPHKNH